MGKSLASVWVLTLCLLLGGCKHPPTLVGVWKGTVFQVEGTATFTDDNKLQVDLKQSGMGAGLNGTYAVSDKDLTLTITDYKLKSVPPILEETARKLFDPLKNRVLKTTYQFNNENEIAITYQGKTDVLKRQTTE